MFFHCFFFLKPLLFNCFFFKNLCRFLVSLFFLELCTSINFFLNLVAFLIISLFYNLYTSLSFTIRIRRWLIGSPIDIYLSKVSQITLEQCPMDIVLMLFYWLWTGNCRLGTYRNCAQFETISLKRIFS